MPLTSETPTGPGQEDAAGAGGASLVSGLIRYLLAFGYGLALCYAYEVLSRWWAYFGFTYRLNDDAWRIGACVIAAVPAVLLRPHPRTFAQASAWFLYALVYIPCLVVPVMQYSSDVSRLLNVFAATFTGCVLFLLIARGEVQRIAVTPLSAKLFWRGTIAIWAILLVVVIVGFGGSLNFVGTDDIYTQRYAGATLAGPVVRYAIALLASAMDPFLIAIGLYNRRYWIIALGASTQVILFGTLAARAVLLSPFLVIGAYFLTNRRGEMRGNLMLIGLLGIFVVTSPLLVRYNPLGGGLDQLTTLIYLRIFLISGATYGVYEQFFALYPLTYFSNNNLVSLLVDYPYGDLSVGQAVLQFLVPITRSEIPELNANFLATDGMAAIGVIGVPVASALAGFVLRVLSRFVPQQRTMLMVAAGTGFILSLANTSLLTSLVTGGGLLLTALVCLVPSDIGDADKRAS
jgi:hypothetical protein